MPYDHLKDTLPHTCFFCGKRVNRFYEFGDARRRVMVSGETVVKCYACEKIALHFSCQICGVKNLKDGRRKYCLPCYKNKNRQNAFERGHKMRKPNKLRQYEKQKSLQAK